MKYIYISILSICLLSSGYGQKIDRSHAPAPAPAPEIQIGNYETFVLPNGMKVFVVENHKIPKVTYSLILDIDPILEKENTGMLSLCSQVLGTATKKRTKDQIDSEVDFIGASINVSAGSASASGLKKHNDKILELFSDMVLNPVFKKEELEKARRQSISGYYSLQKDPNSISNFLKNAVLFGTAHPYGELENENTLNGVTVGQMEKYYQTYYKPNIAYMAIVGDITKDEAQKLMNTYFGAWKKGTVPTHTYAAPAMPSGKQVIIYDRPESVQSVIKVIHPVDLKPGTEEGIKVRVMNTILGGGTYRLFDNLREVHGWTYGAYSQLSSDKLIGDFDAFADVSNAATDSSVVEILGEMTRLQKEPATEEELQRVKNNLSGGFALSLENPSTIARFALNTALYDLDKDYYKNYLKNVEKVTVSDVQAAAQKFLNPENCYVFIVGNKGVIEEGLKRIDSDIQTIDIEGKIQ